MATIIHTGEAKSLYIGMEIIWYILYLLETLLLFRFVLMVFGANPTPFVSFIYSATQPLVSPFLYVVESYRTSSSVFEWSTLLAMLVYWLLSVAIVRLLLLGRPLSETDAEARLEEQEKNI